MSPVVITALVAGSAWLAILTVGLMLCIRQLGAVMVRVELVARGAGGAHSHGAMVGFELSKELVERAPFLAHGRRAILLLSPTCSTCQQLIDEFNDPGPPAGLSLPNELVVLLVQDDGGRAGNDVASALSRYARVVRGTEAKDLARALRLANLPSAILVHNRRVAGSLLFLDRLSQIGELLTGAPALDGHQTVAAIGQPE